MYWLFRAVPDITDLEGSFGLIDGGEDVEDTGDRRVLVAEGL